MNTTILGRRNTWWATGKSSIDSNYRLARNELKDVINKLAERRIQVIIGPRRVGKSTLMQQAIGHLLKAGTDPKRILFFSCDDPTLFDGKTSIGDIINGYFNDILHETVDEIRSRVYIFIDEIHMFSEWQLWLKHYYDPQYIIKFIVSGSSASHLFDGAKESLMGRTDTLRLMPLSFMQFCTFWSAYRDDDKIAEFLRLIPNSSLYIDPAAYYEALKKDAWQWDRFEPYVNAVLKEFLIIGGYPEYFSDLNPVLWQKRLVDDIISQGLYRDIVSIYNIKAPDKLEKLLFFVADNNGQHFNMKTIADTIGCDNETVSIYLTYLTQAYMTVVLSNYAPNVGKALRKNKTLYVLDNGIANALLRLQELSEADVGRIVESVCVRDALTVCEGHHWGLNYWREKDAEIDIVIDKKTEVLPIEVKFRQQKRDTSLQAFRNAFPKSSIPISVIVTKDLLSSDTDSIYIPFRLIQ